MNIFLTISGYVLSIVLYFLGRRDGKKQSYNQKIEDEKKRIVDTYVKWYHELYDSELHALTRLGLTCLENDSNIREVVEKIKKITGRNPLQNEELFRDVNLFDFFQHISENHIDVHKLSPRKIIDEMNR